MRRDHFITGLAAVLPTSACSPKIACSIKPINANGTQIALSYAAQILQWPNRDPLYEFQPNKKLPAASVVKLLVAVALIEATAGNLETLKASRHEDNEGVHRLLHDMIVASDNDAANEIINALSRQTINGVAASLGLTVTRINGDFVETKRLIPPRAFTTAAECNLLLWHIINATRKNVEPAVARAYAHLIALMGKQTDMRFFRSSSPRALVADKTGEIHGELNDVAIIGPYALHPVFASMLAYGPFDVQEDGVLYNLSVLRVKTLSRCLYRLAEKEQ